MLFGLVFLVNAAVGADPSTAGSEYLVSFMENTIHPNQFPYSQCVFITTTNVHVVEANITTAYPGFSFNASLLINNLKGAYVCLDYVVQLFKSSISRKTTKIEASDTVSVMVIERQAASTDIYIAIPTHLYGYEYYVVSLLSKPDAGFYSEFTVTAVKNQTNVTIEFPRNGYFELEYQNITVINPGTLSITLQVNEVFQLLNPTDLTGVYIAADQPIGVVSGHQMTGTLHNASLDHLAQQMTPVATWGTEFVTVFTPRLASNHSDVYRVLASKPNTTVYVNSSEYQLDKEGAWFEANIACNTPVFITSSKSVMVVKYVSNVHMAYASCMMIIVPNEQWMSSYVFMLGKGVIDTAYLILVIQTSSISSLMLNGEPVSSSGWKEVLYTNKSVGYENLNSRTHSVKSQTGVPFMAYVHQTGSDQAFCSPVGMKLEQINADWAHSTMEACPAKETTSASTTHPTTTFTTTTTATTTTTTDTTTTTGVTTTMTSTTAGSVATSTVSTTEAAVTQEGPPGTTDSTDTDTCSCTDKYAEHNITEEELEALVKIIKENLQINPNKTSKHIRTKISIPDFRPVPTSLGVFGAVLVSVTVCLICLQDLNHVVKYIVSGRGYAMHTDTRLTSSDL